MAAELPKAKDRGDEGAAHIANRLSGRVDRAKLNPWQMGDSEIDGAAGQDDIEFFEILMGATGDERLEIYSKLADGESRLLRVLIDKEQPGTHMPKPTLPHFPEVKVDEGLTTRSTLRIFGSRLIPSGPVADSFAKLKFEAEAI